MRHLKKSFALLQLVTLIICSRTSAQQLTLGTKLAPWPQSGLMLERANEVMQDNEYMNTGYEKGNFFINPLLLNGQPLNYTDFSANSKGKLTVIKGAAITGEIIQVPFYVYLRRNGIKVFIPSKEVKNSKQTEIDLSEIFEFAEHGDQLVIEAVNKEDGAVKRILKIFGDGC